MENNEFERSGSDVRKNKGSRPAGRLKRVFTVIAIAVITMALIFSVAGCGEEENKDDNATPGITVPEAPDDPSADTDDPSADEDDPVIDPDDPVIDPDDPVIDPDPENPGEDIPPEDIPPEDIPPEDIPPEDIPPEDIPPEDVPPEDKPPEEENPGQEDPSTEIPGSIDEVDEVDEINYFADEFIERVNQNYGDALAKRMIGASATRENLANADWSISQGSDKGISQIEVKTVYQVDNDTMLRVGTITFDQEYSIQDILNNNVNSSSVSRVYAISTPSSTMETNLDLGKAVIQTIDADNTLEGDIWCNIGPSGVLNGKTYREITVYQITEKGVEKYELRAEAPSADPASIIANIQEGKYTTTSQSTEYTFTGEKIK